MILPSHLQLGRTGRKQTGCRRPSSPRRRPILEPLEDRRLLSRFEVWAIDQSDTTPDGGGTLYIYRDRDLLREQGRPPEVIDLGGEARDLCLAQTGSAPRRPHMFMFNHTHTHMVLAFVATGHVLFMNAATRSPVACIDVGVQAHAAMPAPDDSYVLVANQNGKLLQRITSDFAANTFTLDAAATLDLANGKTPSGAPREAPGLRPDNAPICPIVEDTGRFSFITLRGGGLFVVDNRATPLRIVGEYDMDTVQPNGCGGVQAGRTMYINSGGGTAARPLGANLYAFPLNRFSYRPNPPNTPMPRHVFSYDAFGFVDSHGAARVGNGRHLWVADRAANMIVAVDTRRDRVVNEINLTGIHSSDPAPDLLESSPDGDWVFVALRGPNPLTGNVAGVDNAVGATPGVGVLQVRGNGRFGTFRRAVRISHVVDGVERADPHGIAVRRLGHSPAGPHEEQDSVAGTLGLAAAPGGHSAVVHGTGGVMFLGATGLHAGGPLNLASPSLHGLASVDQGHGGRELFAQFVWHKPG